MKKFALLLILFLVSVPGLCHASDNDKYQKLFYPKGMPVKTSIYGKGQTKYKIYSELKIPDTDLIVVIFSEKIKTDKEALSFKHSLFISILQNANKVYRIKYLKEITNYLKLSSEDEPGYFYEMSGILKHFKISSDINGVHLSIKNVLTGSGGVSSASDIFFLIKNDELVPVLELLNDENGGRSGGSYLGFTYTFIYLSDVDSDGYTDIVTQEYNYEEAWDRDVFISELSPKLNVYKFKNTEEKYELSGQITSLPSGTIKLITGDEPNIKALTKEINDIKAGMKSRRRKK